MYDFPLHQFIPNCSRSRQIATKSNCLKLLAYATVHSCCRRRRCFSQTLTPTLTRRQMAILTIAVRSPQHARERGEHRAVIKLMHLSNKQKQRERFGCAPLRRPKRCSVQTLRKNKSVGRLLIQGHGQPQSAMWPSSPSILLLIRGY